MNTVEEIRNALKKVMPEGEANATKIFKGFVVSTGKNGWHMSKFDQTATYMGKSLDEALEFVYEIAESRRANHV